MVCNNLFFFFYLTHHDVMVGRELDQQDALDNVKKSKIKSPFSLKNDEPQYISPNRT